MQLRAYLNTLSPKDQADFAARCGTSLGYLRKAISINQRLGLTLCVAIERESKKIVTRQALRDDWRDCWPELSAPTKLAHPTLEDGGRPQALSET